jgi:SOS-response transcriptional repressor LexA
MAQHGTTTFTVLEAVYDHYQTSRIGPTLDEIRIKVGLSSPSAVHFHIKKLEEDQLVQRIPGKHRSMRVTRKGAKLVTLMRQFEEYSDAN